MLVGSRSKSIALSVPWHPHPAQPERCGVHQHWTHEQRNYAGLSEKGVPQNFPRECALFVPYAYLAVRIVSVLMRAVLPTERYCPAYAHEYSTLANQSPRTARPRSASSVQRGCGV